MNPLRLILPSLLLGVLSTGSLLAILTSASPLTPYWSSSAAVDLLYWLLDVAVVSWLCRQLGGSRASYLLLAALASYLALALGLHSVVAVLYWAVSCVCAGLLVLQCLGVQREQSSLLGCLFIGTAAYVCAGSVLVQLPINSAALYGVLLGIAPLRVCLFQLHPPVGQWRIAELLSAGQAVPLLRYLQLTLLLAVVGAVARYALYPSLMFDDNSLHLRLWTELLHYRRALFDVEGQVWAVAPFTVDLQHAIVSLLAGEDARGALNLYWLTLLVVMLWQLSGRLLSTSVGDRLWLLVLFLSTPMLGNLLSGLQTELFLAVLTVGGVLLVMQANRSALTAQLAPLLAVAALCCATKLPGAVLGVLLLAAALSQYLILPLASTQPGRPPVWQLLLWGLFLLALAVLAFQAYVNAWWRTGNPVFPLYNTVFQSPYFDSTSDFSDSRWQHGLSLHTFWRVFTHTSEFHEGRDFVAGFQYLWLLPAALVAWALQRFPLRWLPVLVPALGFATIMFASTQYWRYQFPTLPLACLLIGILASEAARRWQRMLYQGAMLGCLLLNVWFYPGVSWFFAEPPGSALTAESRARLQAVYAPTRTINDYLNSYAPGRRVVYPGSTPYGATLRGEPLYVTWVAPALLAKAAQVRNQDDLQALLQAERVDYVIRDLQEPLIPNEGLWVLSDYLSRFATAELKVGELVLYRLHDHEKAYREVYRLPAAMALTATAQPLASLPLSLAGNLRLRIAFRCSDDTGMLAAQVSWDVGQVYYRQLPCSATASDFREAVPVPPGAREAALIVSGATGVDVEVSTLTVELN